MYARLAKLPYPRRMCQLTLNFQLQLSLNFQLLTRYQVSILLFFLHLLNLILNMMLIFLLLTVKEKEVALFIDYITSSLMLIFTTLLCFCFSHLILILFHSGSDAMPNLGWRTTLED